MSEPTETATDILGRVLTVGDTIAYPIQSGRSSFVALAVIDAIEFYDWESYRREPERLYKLKVHRVERAHSNPHWGHGAALEWSPTRRGAGKVLTLHRVDNVLRIEKAGEDGR